MASKARPTSRSFIGIVSSTIGDIRLDREHDLARADRETIRRKVLAEAGPCRAGPIEKAFEMPHRPGGQVVQDHQRPSL